MLVFHLLPLDLASSLFCRQSAASLPVTAALTPRGLTAGVSFNVIHLTVSLLWRAAWLKYDWQFDLSWKLFHFVYNYTHKLLFVVCPNFQILHFEDPTLSWQQTSTTWTFFRPDFANWDTLIINEIKDNNLAVLRVVVIFLWSISKGTAQYFGKYAFSPVFKRVQHVPCLIATHEGRSHVIMSNQWRLLGSPLGIGLRIRKLFDSLSEFDPIGLISFGKFRASWLYHFISIRVSVGLNRKLANGPWGYLSCTCSMG